MPMLCEQLGQRLLNEGGDNQENIENAILCYICAGNIEKLVEVWPKPNKNSGDSKLSNDLQELIEVVMLLQKAIELQGRNVDVSGKLAEILSRYAGLLAAQGALSSAVTYLGPSDDANVEDLRDRLYYSLGYKQAYASPAPMKPQFNQQANQIKPQARHSLPNNQVPLPLQQQPVYNTNFSSQNTSSFNTGFSGPPTMPPAVQPWANPTPAVQSWNTFPNQPQPPLVPNPVQAKPLVPPPANDHLSQQPARPSSVGSQGSAPSSRNKYLLDPSVQSGPTYSQSNMYTPQMNSNFQNFGQAPLSNFNTAPINQPQTNQFMPFVPTPAPTNNFMSGVPPIELAQQALQQRNPTPPPGWNDPPPLKTSRQPVSLSYFYKTVRNLNAGSKVLIYLNKLKVHCTHNSSMSAEHAGTRKWNKILKSHSNKSSKVDKVSDLNRLILLILFDFCRVCFFLLCLRKLNQVYERLGRLFLKT